MRGLARAANREYDAVCRAYLGGHGYPDVAQTTGSSVARAVTLTVATWRVVLERKGRRDPGRAGEAWAWVAAILAVAYFAMRGPGRDDAARWSGAGPAPERPDAKSIREAWAGIDALPRAGAGGVAGDVSRPTR
jgi:hypothetical protein